MRFFLPASALALALATVSSVSVGKKPDSEIDKRSVELTDQGQAHAAAGRIDPAIDSLESALAVDPKNRRAIILLAEMAKKQEMPGKAIRLYREALLIEPNDVDALAGQGEAMVAKGAVDRAQENLDRIAKVCASNCAQQLRLSAAIEKFKTKPVIAAEAIQAKPVVTKN